MNLSRIPLSFASAVIASLIILFTSGCSDPSKQALKEERDAVKTQTGVTLPKTPLAGKELNPFFPKEQAGYQLVFTQEKPGLALAEMKDGTGATVAQLSIADLATNPETLGKYVGVTERVEGYPVTASGSLGTSILVGNQFQVSVRAKTDSFGDGDRRKVLSKFDLKGLAAKSKAQGQL